MNRVDLNCRPALAPGVRLQADPVSGEPVLLYPEGVLVLNETAHAIAGHCDGNANVREIVTALSTEYEIDEVTLSADALECLGDLAGRNLIVLQP
jgi:coenzyme PQQ biosynthesis protein PqqD